MKILVTGGAGFIASHLTEFLVSQGHEVTVLDNLSTGKVKHLDSVIDKITFVDGDIRDYALVDNLVPGVEMVFHFCCYSDIQQAFKTPEIYVDQNVLGCFNLLQTMRKYGVKKIAFPSSTTVLGNVRVAPTPETYGPLQPINMYGAGKLACEAIISGYVHAYEMQAWIFRFVNMIGGRMDHGAIFDFVRKIKNDPTKLQILGDGTSHRSFMLVDDCVSAIWHSIQNLNDTVNLIHIGNQDQINITRAAELTIQAMGLKDVKLEYTGSAVGWKGDVPTNYIATETLDRLGWKAERDSSGAVLEAARRLAAEYD